MKHPLIDPGALIYHPLPKISELRTRFKHSSYRACIHCRASSQRITSCPHIVGQHSPSTNKCSTSPASKTHVILEEPRGWYRVVPERVHGGVVSRNLSVGRVRSPLELGVPPLMPVLTRRMMNERAPVKMRRTKIFYEHRPGFLRTKCYLETTIAPPLSYSTIIGNCLTTTDQNMAKLT